MALKTSATITIVEEKVMLEWNCTPEYFFEEAAQIKGELCTFRIENGKIIADVTGVSPLPTSPPQDGNHWRDTFYVL